MRSGNIVDMEAATRAISSAVSTAEEMCGEHVREVIVGVSGGSPASHNQSLEVAIGHHEIGERDVRRVQQHIHLPAETADRDIIHSEAIGYTVDGTPVRDARGMFGERLGVDVHLVTAASGSMRNLQVCVRRAHLEIAERVVASHAAGLSSLVADERDLGVTLIDMGGGTTSIAVFYEGNLVHVDSIPVGGEHVTRDIARGLSHAGRPCRAHEDADRPRRRQAQRRVRHHRRAADRRGGPHAAQPHPALDSRRHHPPAHRGDVRAGAQPTRGSRCG